jgi:photosystem II stability/assembly factor-like uncharacterized protein
MSYKITGSNDKNMTEEKNKRLDEGPRGWQMPRIESAYSRLIPREKESSEEAIAAAESAAVTARAVPLRKKAPPKAGPLISRLQPGRSDEVLGSIPRDYWVKRLSEYKQRKVAAIPPRLAVAPGMPAIPGVNNWVPIGPSVAAHGQAVGRPAIAGRVTRIAIAPGGNRIYAATANGGVFRSDDAGRSWFSTMDGFDLDPTNFASASLICGAIAINQSNPDRVYVGTGEGDTDSLFVLRLTNALPSYRGIGPIRTDDGGVNWVSEASTPSLAGFAFYELAVDPSNPDNVVGATTNGLYQRTVSDSTPNWQQRRTGNHCSVVVTRSGSTTTFYAATWGGPVYLSTDGATWSVVGTGFPSSNVGRITLAVQPDNPNILYALVANGSGGLLGIYRLDGGTGSWHNITGAPNIVPGSQGDYDLCIAIDPNNANLIYIGGDYYNISPYPGNIQRCVVAVSGSTYSMVATSIGTNAHADVHSLVFVPGDSNHLWTGTDGGCFLNNDPAGIGSFEARNTGLSCLCADCMGMSPSEPAVIYCGLQDNGTVRYLGEELWRHVLYGDGGYCVVHPTNPFRALVYANGTVYRTSTGGGDYNDWTIAISPPWSLMIEPLVGAPASESVAFGAGNRIYVSNDFGTTWPATISPTMTLPAGSGSIYSMIFANDTRLFVGTTNGRVFRADLAGGTWSLTRIDNVAGGALPLIGLISDIAVDWSDAARNSVYICFGGNGDTRHVWRFNGTAWQARSGSGATSLIDVEHNAIIVDPANTNHVYVGADIGVWRSTDGGNTWTPLQNGLPDAPVFDLQLHAGARLLRASTHGRGLYEYRLDPPTLGGIELYIRDTMLDTARGENTDWRDDPSIWPTTPVYHWESPNIKIDVPTSAGYQTLTNQVDFFQFHELIVDGSQGVATVAPPAVIHNRVYVLVHNRGPLIATSVYVMVAVTNASTVLNPLPAGYTANIQAGTPLPGPDWTTLGTVTLSNLRPGFPQVAAFDLPSNILPLPASLPGQSHYCLLAFAHSVDDPYTATEKNVDPLTIQERKVGQKNLHLVEFIGTPPPPKTWLGIWARLDITGFLFRKTGIIDLVFDLRRFPGKIRLLVPEALVPDILLGNQKDFATEPNPLVEKWNSQYLRGAKRLLHEGKFRQGDFDSLINAMKLVAKRPVLVPRITSHQPTLIKIPIGAKDRHTIFLRIDPPLRARVGQSWEFSVIQRDSKTKKTQGGATYSVRINRPPAKEVMARGDKYGIL